MAFGECEVKQIMPQASECFALRFSRIERYGNTDKRYFPLTIDFETYLIPGETLIPGGRGRGKGEGKVEGGKGAFHPGIGYASYLA